MTPIHIISLLLMGIPIAVFVVCGTYLAGKEIFRGLRYADWATRILVIGVVSFVAGFTLLLL